jgi:hypothetical protein
LCHGRVRPRAVQRHVRVEYLVEHAAARVKGTYLTGRKPTETTNRPASWPESNSQVGPLENYHGVTARIALASVYGRRSWKDWKGKKSILNLEARAALSVRQLVFLARIIFFPVSQIGLGLNLDLGCKVWGTNNRDLNFRVECTVLPLSVNKCTISSFGSQTFLNLIKLLHKNSNICDIKLS